MRCMVSKNKRIIALGLCLILLLLSGCRNAQQKKSVQFFSMDTLMQITAYGGSETDSALQKARRLIESFDREFDATDPDGWVSRLQNGEKPRGDIAAVLQTAQQIGNLTEGALDLTLYPLSDAWGFYSKKYTVPDTEQIRTLLQNKGAWKIENDIFSCTPGTKLDLGSVAKGYAGDQAAAILRDAGIRSAVLSLGGNVQTVGAKPDGSSWTVAVADPNDPQNTVGNLFLIDMAAVTSGSYQRNFRENGKLYHHILDPATGCPVENDLLSATVVCREGVIADGLSTALFVMGTEKSLQFYRTNVLSFEALFITKRNEILITEGLADRFEKTNADYRDAQILR